MNALTAGAAHSAYMGLSLLEIQEREEALEWLRERLLVPAQAVPVLCKQIRQVHGMRGFWQCSNDLDHSGDHESRINGKKVMSWPNPCTK